MPRRKRKPTDDFEEAVQGVLGDCSLNMKALAARSGQVDTEANVGSYVAARLRLLPKKIQCQAINGAKSNGVLMQMKLTKASLH